MAHAQKPDFVFLRNGRVHLNQRGYQFSRLLAAEVCASAVVMLDAPCSEVVWSVPATHSIRRFPLHFPSRALPCAITFQLDYKKTGCMPHIPLIQAYQTRRRILWSMPPPRPQNFLEIDTLFCHKGSWRFFVCNSWCEDPSVGTTAMAPKLRSRKGFLLDSIIMKDKTYTNLIVKTCLLNLCLIILNINWSNCIIIIIINIKDWTLWSVPSPELQLLAPTLLRSYNCSPSLWSVVVWFQRDWVLWHSFQA